MNYGDLSSLVQLGVSLHLGTALLQFYGELGMQPLIRTMQRLKVLIVDCPDTHDQALTSEFEALESRLDVFRIQFFNEYKRYVFVNSGIGILLIFVLIGLAFAAQEKVPSEQAWLIVLIVFLSTAPAPLSLLILWRDASCALAPIEKEAKELERRAIHAA